MRFFTQIAAFAATAATLVSANSMTFVNQDGTTRHITFTPSAGHAAINAITIKGNGQQKVSFPQGWIGNAYSTNEGAPNVPGMLAEVTFNGWNGLTYFDVSAIVNPNDHNGVKQMYPASQLKTKIKSVVSGCLVFPCNTAYYAPNDIQTVTTKETDLIVTLGNSKVSGRDLEEEESMLVPRHFVLGKLSEE
ncbi:hypothetical protein F5Y04DRAFT_92274 [Hypomontagnella monticulosa]|nr:hypothetical protein F5Y04DRAFT_92274 [Hypomontagnella monticulosa]